MDNIKIRERIQYSHNNYYTNVAGMNHQFYLVIMHHASIYWNHIDDTICWVGANNTKHK